MIRVNADIRYLWRAVDKHGFVLDVLLQKRRNETKARRFFQQSLNGIPLPKSCLPGVLSNRLIDRWAWLSTRR
jgi:hypothetical protein